ncbi:MAG: chemotaxis protein [Massilia sp.]|nr:chemotaxis protein [Massilia sp.]
MKIKNLAIGTRLAGGFAIVLALTIVVAGLGINGMSRSNAALERIVNKKVYKMELLHGMSDSVHVVARVSRSIVLVSDSGEIEAEAKKIIDARSRYNTAWTALLKTPATPAGEQKRATVLAAQQLTGPLNDKVIQLARNNSDAEAIQVLMREAAPATNKWQAAIAEYVDQQLRNNKLAAEEAAASYDAMHSLVLGLAALAVLIGIAVAWLVTRSITVPTNAAVKIAQAVAAGDLTSHIVVQSSDETGKLMQALKDMNHSLINIVGEVRGGTDLISTASSEIAAGNHDLSSRTEEQASSLEETASSMEELTSTVRQNADNARQADQLARSATDVAVRGGTVVSKVVETMDSINAASTKIVDIIAVIDSIAFQTNILALNAAVEAARAGEQGRGFAVVASEVRNLAQRSAAAAKEIKVLITDSVRQVGDGARLVDQAGSTMQDIVDSVKRVSDIIGEISLASQEQTAGIEQINVAISQMDTVTQQNASLVEEAAAASESMHEQAALLARAVSIFKMDHPIDGLKAPAATQARALTMHRLKPDTLRIGG